MTKLAAWIGLAASCLWISTALAQERDDRELIARAAAERAGTTNQKEIGGQSPSAGSSRVADNGVVTKDGVDSLAAEERHARAELALSQVQLELVLARKDMKSETWADAAKHALAAQRLVQQLPKDIDASVWDLQAEGILAKAEKAGVKVETLRRGTKVAGASAARKQSQPAVHAQSPATTSPPAGTVAVVPAVPPGSSPAPTANPVADAKPAGGRGAVFEVEMTQHDADEMRLQYESRLYDAYKGAEARNLIEADEARITPAGEIGYPADWPQIVQRRAKYSGGEIAKSNPWTDKDGKEWYSAIYDIRDLTYEVPDFAPALTGDFTEDLRNALDRQALRDRSMIFGGYAEDLARGIPLLRYFGGVDDMEFRGPKYSIEKQKQIMEQIRAFTTPSTEAKIIPLGSP